MSTLLELLKPGAVALFAIFLLWMRSKRKELDALHEKLKQKEADNAVKEDRIKTIKEGQAIKDDAGDLSRADLLRLLAQDGSLRKSDKRDKM
jgi:hypothetical protein